MAIRINVETLSSVQGLTQVQMRGTQGGFFTNIKKVIRKAAEAFARGVKCNIKMAVLKTRNC